MIQSLFSGVSGMLANQSEMDVIGNNIANANTTAFKGSTTDFDESFVQQTRSATVNDPVGLGVGLGAQVAGTTTNFGQGVFQTTNVPTDMGINGNGFFVVQSTGGNNYVTRNGTFVEDSSGYLRTTNGDFLMGTIHQSSASRSIRPARSPLRARMAARIRSATSPSRTSIIRTASPTRAVDSTPTRRRPAATRPSWAAARARVRSRPACSRPPTSISPRSSRT